MSRAKRLALVVVTVLVAAASVALVASAAPSPRVMKLACASDLYGEKKVLRYVARAADCSGSRNRLVRFAAGAPLLVCLKERSVSVGLRKAVRGARSKAPAGLMRLVDSPTKCKPGSRLSETARALPAGTALWFCAAKASGELRMVGKHASCGSREFRVTLPKRKKPPSGPPVGGPGETPGETPGGPPDQTPGGPPDETPAPGGSPGGNSAPVAGDDSTTTDESSARVITVLHNDTDPDGDALHVASIDTTGTIGSATLNGDGTITYDPNGKFRSLKAGETATDSFEYTAGDRTAESAPATVKVTVTGLNEAPSAAADTATTFESGAVRITVLSNDTDADADPLRVGSIDTTGTVGAATVNGDGTITYDPNGKFRSLKVGQTATDSFRYRANDGHVNSSPATVTVTITGLNEPPGAVADTATTAKSRSVQIPVLTNDTDPDGDALHVASIDTTGTQGTVTQNPNGTLTYDPNHHFDSLGASQSAHDTFKYKASDGHQDSNAATVDVTVTGSDTAPVVTTSAGSTAYTEGATAVAVDGAVTVTDPDSANLASAQVRLSSGFQPGDELLFTNQNGITGSYAAATGVLTLTGGASKASYQTALRSVRYQTGTNTDPSTSKTVEFRASDGTTTSAAATKLLAVTPVSTTDPLDALVAHDLSFAGTQLQRTLTETATDAYPLETRTNGRWVTTAADQWTSGFFPGSLWLMYQATGDSAWRTAAQARQAGLESLKTNTTFDDLGFMLFDSFGNGYKLTGTDSYRQVVLTAAQSLATRYSPTVGAIRSFNNSAGAPANDFQVVVDDLMNMELLYWASKHGGPSSLADKALQDALTVIRTHIRADGSSYHLVVFNSDDGSVKRKGTVQGYSDNSTWSRGQAWCVYGFTMAYRESNDARMLTAARRVADWYIAHLPSDSVPYWDFDAPGIPNEPRDTSAAAVAASGLIELSQLETDATRKQRYLAAAKATLTSLSSSSYLAEGTSARSVLLHGTYNKPVGDYDTGLSWGDYYFLEALLRYKALN